jgi:hypothetical protein
VVDEVNGVWGTAEEVPGTAALNTGPTANLYSVSCASAGNCAASGDYTDSSGLQAFVVNEVNGTWGTAEEIPGTATLNKGGVADAFAVSCASAGNCSAGGEYENISGYEPAFVVNEVNGTWQDAKRVPGIATLDTDGYAWIYQMSCVPAGNCSAGGYYTDGSGRLSQAFVVDEVNGTWRTAEEVPSTAALNAGESAETDSVSCSLGGSCSAVGDYKDASDQRQLFLVSQP